MVPYQGPHFQTNHVDNWPQAVAEMPPGTWVKAIDSVQLLSQARSVNPGIKNVLRHFDGGWQRFDFVDHAERRAHARRFLESFVDGTFLEHAHNVDCIEELNEYVATSHTGAEKEKRVEWVRAVCQEWAEFRLREQRVAHIRLVVGNVAIGNDLPVGAARIIQDHDAIAGYHPYVPFRKPEALARVTMRMTPPGQRPRYTATRASLRGPAGEPYQLQVDFDDAPRMVLAAAETQRTLPGVMDNEWPWLSGRWTEMDARYRAEGVEVDWLFTEAGPIGYYDGGGLDPMAGWRHGDVCGGDVELYLDVLEYWMERATAWNARHDGRALGAVLFNSGGAGNEWKHFETQTPELKLIAALNNSFEAPAQPDPEPDPEPEPEPERRYSRTYHLLPQDATLDEKQAVVEAAHDSRATVGQSTDDAFLTAPELTGRTVHVWEVERVAGDEAELEAWVEAHYPPLPEIRYRRIGELFVADVWQAPVGGPGAGGEEERGSGELWPGEWTDENPFGNYYQLGDGHAYHTGSDLNLNAPVWDADRNMPVWAPASGRVVYAGEPSRAWANVVVIRHEGPDGDVAYSRLAHLGLVTVEEGQWVKAGAMVGTVGRNRTDAGPGPYHLHLDISPTEILHTDPGHWPGENRAEVLKHYVDPKEWIEARR